MKHKNNYRIYEVDQDLINFLRGDGRYINDEIKHDPQIYSHYGQVKEHSDKYIGIIIELNQKTYFAPITHDGDKKWLQRDDSYDFEIIYDSLNKYAGSLLLCKALPLTHNLVHYISIDEIAKQDRSYGLLCRNELQYLNSPPIHDRIQDKMQACIYGKQSSCMKYRVDYNRVIENVKEYNKLKEQQEHSCI